MRCMVLVKATPESESGAMPSEELLAAMGAFNEQLVEAGMMLAGEGLHASSRGKRVRFGGGKPTVSDGPFAGTKDLVAGFWIWKVDSIEEAVDWAKRCPMAPGSELEVRPVIEVEDFGPELTPELREQEEELRVRVEAQRRASDG